jgi:hypothetical protein
VLLVWNEKRIYFVIKWYMSDLYIFWKIFYDVNDDGVISIFIIIFFISIFSYFAKPEWLIICMKVLIRNKWMKHHFCVLAFCSSYVESGGVPVLGRLLGYYVNFVHQRNIFEWIGLLYARVGWNCSFLSLVNLEVYSFL